MDDIKDLYCANCGGWYGIHNYRTMQCPVGGREAPDGRKQEWKDTTFVAIPEPQTMTHQAESDAQAARIAALEALLSELLNDFETGYMAQQSHRADQMRLRYENKIKKLLKG